MKGFFDAMGYGLALVFILLITAAAIDYLTGYAGSNHVLVKYDCRLAEISPDFPVAVKQACRERTQK